MSTRRVPRAPTVVAKFDPDTVDLIARQSRRAPRTPQSEPPTDVRIEISEKTSLRLRALTNDMAIAAQRFNDAVQSILDENDVEGQPISVTNSAPWQLIVRVPATPPSTENGS